MTEIEEKYLELFESLKEIDSVLSFKFDTMPKESVKIAVRLARKEASDKINNSICWNLYSKLKSDSYV